MRSHISLVVSLSRCKMRRQRLSGEEISDRSTSKTTPAVGDDEAAGTLDVRISVGQARPRLEENCSKR